MDGLYVISWEIRSSFCSVVEDFSFGGLQLLSGVFNRARCPKFFDYSSNCIAVRNRSFWKRVLTLNRYACRIHERHVQLENCAPLPKEPFSYWTLTNEKRNTLNDNSTLWFITEPRLTFRLLRASLLFTFKLKLFITLGLARKLSRSLID